MTGNGKKLRVTLAVVGEQISFIKQQLEQYTVVFETHMKEERESAEKVTALIANYQKDVNTILLGDGKDIPGHSTRLDRLEQQEGNRKKHLRIIYAVLSALAAGIVTRYVFGG